MLNTIISILSENIALQRKRFRYKILSMFFFTSLTTLKSDFCQSCCISVSRFPNLSSDLFRLLWLRLQYLAKKKTFNVFEFCPRDLDPWGK